jgi:aminoglycoside 3-N-acetyltransferase
MNIKDRIFTISPYFELILRHFYWNKYLHKLLKKIISFLKSSSIKENKNFNIDDIFDTLSKNNINNGSLIILHSSYETLSKTGLSPKEIINKFINYLGEDGTLAMNAARIIKKDKIEDVEVYNLQSSRVWTGVLPAIMVKDPRSYISKFPINSMVAIGKLASNMMENNIKIDYLSSCGPHSSWNFCYENNAEIIGIGIDLVHSLTMIHVAEETINWPVKNWFTDRNFKIIDNDNTIYLKIKDRKLKWGQKHFAERTLYKDLLNNSILKIFKINSIEIQFINSKQLIEYLYKKNSKGYPYFFL